MHRLLQTLLVWFSEIDWFGFEARYHSIPINSDNTGPLLLQARDKTKHIERRRQVLKGLVEAFNNIPYRSPTPGVERSAHNFKMVQDR